MAEKIWYQDWFSSPFYHKLYFERDDKEAADFIQRLVSYLQPAPGCRMLDVACGRGRHSKILAGMGFSVTGIDISFSSIASAKANETENLEFYVHDMRLPFHGNYFHYAFNFFTSFGYFGTRREHDDAIRSIAKSLQPGGIFVIDYLNVHYAEDHLVPQENRHLGGTVYTLQRWHDENHFFKKISVADPALNQPLAYTEKVAKFSLGDFTDMLAFQGLQVQEVFGDYQLLPYDVRKTPRMIIVAKKVMNTGEGQKRRLYSDGRTTDPLT